MERILYEELTPNAFQARLAQAPIAYLPLGTLEWHGLHLPLGSDGMQSRGLFCELARRVGGIVMPMLFVAPDKTQTADGKTYIGMDFWSRPEGEAPRQLPGSAYYVSDELFRQLLDSIMIQLARAGFKIVVAHGHGPSSRAFRALIPTSQEKYGLILMTAQSDEDSIGFQSDHAAANETSIMMHFHSDLVDMAALDPDPAVRPEGVWGEDPRIHASAELGAAVTEQTADRMCRVLRELCASLK